MLSMTVRGHALPFLVDTGATRSTVNQDIGPLSGRTMSVVGFSGFIRDVFSFTYQRRRLRYTRLPQGFALSPGIFNQVLKESLADLQLPDCTTVIQYVDDLLIASTTAESCLQATRALLLLLARHGFKGASLSPAHRTSVLHHTKPDTVKAMLSFLGLVGYSRQYIPDFSTLTSPLRAMVTSAGVLHECAHRVEKELKAREDLQTEPIPGARNLYTDGCCYRDEKEGPRAGFSVIEETPDGLKTVTAQKLNGPQSAQRAEVVAVIEALKAGKDQDINIYTDSAYAVHAAQVDLGQWMRAGYLTAKQEPIKHMDEMKELAKALWFPQKVAIIKCKGHDNSGSRVAMGNQAADSAAKAAAGYHEKLLLVRPDTETQMTKLSLTEISKEQDLASPEEKTVWKLRGAVLSEGTWRSPDGRLVLPPGLKDSIFSEAHGVGHAGISQMKVDLKEWWHPFLHDMLKEWVRHCTVCTHHNTRPTYKPGVGWPEAWPVKREDSKSVVKCLINHYIPEKIRSDNGSHFKNQDLHKQDNWTHPIRARTWSTFSRARASPAKH
ncbi:LOW QUALITY PROTEIN: uncharacterized protein LOC113137770%2C partial [Xyrichtys novacula]|uniref:ribonuclease H n=1 Tax=Xyrichtys novacula TaxID=13765 RepID=A0AAV1G088_XYRNO|nr:LOW QUALITY PROTEIN: uncharacterized protein LOC113137770%2C partial [Xyrichtys novacula]